MSDNDILNQYASSATLSTRRGLYDNNVGVSLTDRIDEQLQLEHASTLLDVGCGYGADITTFTQRYPNLKITGFDQSEAQVSDAKAATPSATIFVGDANSFELSEKFDRILVRHVLHLVPNPRAVLERVLKHCQSGGHIVIAVHSTQSQPHFMSWRSWFMTQTGISCALPNEKLSLENQ